MKSNFATGLLTSSLAPSLFYAFLLLLLTACGGGGGNSDENASADADTRIAQCTQTTLSPWAISDAGNAGLGSNIAEPCDQFQYEDDVNTALNQWEQIWSTLAAARTWTETSNPLYTYSFYEDVGTPTNFGRAYRYTGFDVAVGSIRTPMAIVGPGTYTTPQGDTYSAMILQTWDMDSWEMIVIIDERNFAHFIQHTNGLPIITYYRY